MVLASRRHLTERYATGVDRLLWDTEKRLLPDLEAIALVNAASSAGRAETLDRGAALILIQAARLDLDRREYEAFEGAHAVGMTDEAIAAVLDLPDAAAAASRRRWLVRRQRLARAEAPRVDPATTALRTSANGRRTSASALRTSASTAETPGIRPAWAPPSEGPPRLGSWSAGRLSWRET